MINDLAKKIELLIIDIDGVLTDGKITINGHGVETKSFNVKDGQGLRLLMKAGVDIAIITGRESKIVEYRARELGIKDVYQGVKDKKTVCKDLIKRKALKKEQVCCIGDDLPDIPMFNYSGFPVAVADAIEEVCAASRYVTKKKGGDGAVREVCEIILKAKDLWKKIVSDLTQAGN